MRIKEYIFLNRIIVVVGILIFSLFILLIDSGSIACVNLAYTGKECASCGITRDFLSFLQLDFSEPINQHSIGLFIYCTFQFLYRILIATLGLKFLWEHTYGQNSILNRVVKKVDIKKVIIADAMITFLFGILVFLPFWI